MCVGRGGGGGGVSFILLETVGERSLSLALSTLQRRPEVK